MNKITLFIVLYSFVFFCEAADDNDAIKKHEIIKNVYIVKTDFMEMKTFAGRGFPVHTIIEKGESFSIVKKRTDWLKIKSLLGDVGWINIRDFYKAIGNVRYKEKQEYLLSAWELGVSGGTFGREQSYALSAGYYTTPSLLVSLEALQISGLYSSSSLGAVNIAFNIYRHFILSPFINAGSGVLLNAPRQSLVNAQNDTQIFSYYGGGFSVNSYKNMSIRLGVRNYYLFEKKENFYEWRVGVYGVLF